MLHAGGRLVRSPAAFLQEEQMTGIRRLNHAVLFATDVDRATTFYANVLGFVEVTRVPQMSAVFLRAADSANHHDLGLFGLGASAAPRQPRGVGLYHLAWQVDTIDQLAELRKALLDAGAYTGESSHGATKSIYGADPDGNEFELMWMVPRAAWGRYESEAVVEALDLEGELAIWSGVGTADELGGFGETGWSQRISQADRETPSPHER
jgi:catechol-2,3-dioxygenase